MSPKNCNTYCLMPFINIEISSTQEYRPCCKYIPGLTNKGKILTTKNNSVMEAWESDSLHDLRQNCENGIRSSGCLRCWDEEEAGIESLRQNILKLTNTCETFTISKENKPKILNIKNSIACNLKCRICGPWLSSSWGAESDSDSSPYRSEKITPLTALDREIIQQWVPSLKRIEIYGGEPFLEHDNLAILSQIVSMGHAPNIELTFNTNATIYNSDLIELLGRFNYVVINFSIDDIGERFEYQRHGARWKNVQEVVRSFQDALRTSKIRGELSIYCTLSLLNIFYFPEFLKWKDQTFPELLLYMNYVHFPAYYSIQCLPGYAKEIITEKLSDDSNEITEALLFMNAQDKSELFTDFLKETNRADKYRNENFPDTFPEYYDLILEALESSLRDTYCNLRWNYPIIDFSRGAIRTCCRTPEVKITPEEYEELGTDIFLNMSYQKKRRFEHLVGIKHESCSSCWALENAQVRGPRLCEHAPMPWVLENASTDVINKLTPKELRDLTFVNRETNEKASPPTLTGKSPLLESHRPFMLEIALSTNCDLMCAYCSPQFSSSWQQESLALGKIDRHYVSASQPLVDTKKLEEDFWTWLSGSPSQSLDRIGFVGGEPLLAPNFFPFLDRLKTTINSTNRNKPLTVWIVTNLNTPKHLLDRLVECLPLYCQSFNVEIHASTETLEAQAEYLRYGLSWQRFDDNINRLFSLDLENLNIGFQIAINNLSLVRFKDFLKYTKNLHDNYKKPVALKHNVISIPNQFSPLILPPEFASYLDDCISFLKEIPASEMLKVDDPLGTWEAYIPWLTEIANGIRNQTGHDFKWMHPSLGHVQAEFARWVNHYDQRRGTSFKQTFPEYSDFYSKCEKKRRELNKNG